jgi:hypothetical protein
VEEWFRKSKRDPRANDIKEIVMQYPQDKNSGCYTAIYNIDPERPWISKGGKACTNTEEIAQALSSESAYYMDELKKPNARLYLYLRAVGGANEIEATGLFYKYFAEYSPKRALSLVCLKLQDNCVTIGSQKYERPDEIAQEKDSSQINLIKKEIMENESFLMVWLAAYYKDKLTSADKFSQQPASGQFFLLGLCPYLSYKELNPNWQRDSAKILLGFIDDSPGRADLFEAYAAQGLPLSDTFEYIVTNFDSMKAKHGVDTMKNVIRLLIKLGANAGTARYYAMDKRIDDKSLGMTGPFFSTDDYNKRKTEIDKYNQDNNNKGNTFLELLLIDMGAKPNTETLRIAIEAYHKECEGNIYTAGYSLRTHKKMDIVERLLKMGAEPGDTLCLAAEYGSSSLVDLLLKYGAKRNVKDKHGKTPYDYAKNGNSNELKIELKPHSFKLLEYVLNLKRKLEHLYDNLPWVFWVLTILFATISVVGTYLGTLAIFDRLAGFDFSNWFNLLWPVGIGIAIGIGTFLSFVYRGMPPLIMVIMLGLGILGFGFHGFIPQPYDDRPPFTERIWYGPEGKPAPIKYPDPIEITIQTATVTSDSLNMRNTPSSSGALVKTLKKGDILTVSGEPTENGWMPVEHSGDSGYVSASLITTNPVTVEIARPTATVKRIASMTDTPKTFGKDIKRLQQGDIVIITGDPIKNDFTPVEHNGDFGYLLASVIELTGEYSVIQTPEQTTSSQTTSSQTTSSQTTPAQMTTSTQTASNATKGKLTFGNDVYEGDIVNGKAHGKGKYTSASGTVYEGDFVNDDFHGKGKITWNNGASYEGDFINNKRHGKGRYSYSNGNVYEGDYTDDKQTGKGKFIYADGAVYEGDFVNGDFNGRGKMTYADGRVEDGRWENDKFLGR